MQELFEADYLTDPFPRLLELPRTHYMLDSTTFYNFLKNPYVRDRYDKYLEWTALRKDFTTSEFSCYGLTFEMIR